jgi:hypothetical protein
MRVNNVRPLDHRLHRSTLAQKSEPEMDDLMFNMDIEEETPIGAHRNLDTYHNTIDTSMFPMLGSDSKVRRHTPLSLALEAPFHLPSRDAHRNAFTPLTFTPLTHPTLSLLPSSTTL